MLQQFGLESYLMLIIQLETHFAGDLRCKILLWLLCLILFEHLLKVLLGTMDVIHLQQQSVQSDIVFGGFLLFKPLHSCQELPIIESLVPSAHGSLNCLKQMKKSWMLERGINLDRMISKKDDYLVKATHALLFMLEILFLQVVWYGI